jgi:hypothetical protein
MKSLDRSKIKWLTALPLLVAYRDTIHPIGTTRIFPSGWIDASTHHNQSLLTLYLANVD